MSVHIYPVPAGEVISHDLAVSADGINVPVHEMYVSAYPFNRRWPGHQRSEDQRELAYFVSFDMDAPVRIVIRPNRAFQAVVVRPASKKIMPSVKDGSIEFTLSSTGGYSVEIDGTHHALHLFANPCKKYDVDPKDENTLYFPAGLHEAGLIELKSNQTLYLDEGAVLFARIYAKDAENIKILGRGILDNSHIHAEILFVPEKTGEGDFALHNAKRHHTIRLEACRNIEIDGITIRDSLVYNIAPYNCDDVVINNVKIVGCWRYNSDGIDMQGCRRCHVSNCFIRTYDDSICVKGLDETYQGAVRFSGDIIAENCVIWNDWGKCLEIGAETKADDMSRIVFRNCDLIHLTGPVLDIFNVDHADIHDVTYENINVEYAKAYQKSQIQKNDDDVFDSTDAPGFLPTLMSASIVKHPEYSYGREKRGKIHDITFRNIRVTAPAMPPSHFFGYDEDHQTRDITIADLYLNGNKITSLAEANISMGDFTENITLR